MVGTRSLSSGAHSRDPLALPTLRFYTHRPHPEERRSRVSKDSGSRASWFETREDALLTMRVDGQSFRNTIEAIQPVISAMKAVTRP
jgi:hypothetical protein